MSKTIKKLYPEWIIRVYHDDTIDSNIICELECQKDSNNNLLDNIVFCDVNNLPESFLDTNFRWSASFMNKMMWRWLPIGDSFVDVFMSRDSDSYMLQREVDSVNVWLNSTKLGHIMRGRF